MDLDLLARVSNAYGVPGFEDDIQALAEDVLSKCCDETRRDRMGNVIGVKRAQADPGSGSRPLRVVIAAHSDEIGMLVKHITPEGYIKFQPIGGLHAPSIVSQHVVIFGREKVRGVIAPHHGMAEAVPPLEGLFIDVGRPVDEVRALVDTGDAISFTQEFGQLNDNVVTGRNFDDRIGTYCLLEAMRGAPAAAVDVYAVSTVQEELGVRGMPVAAYDIDADIGLAIDGSICRGPHPNPHDPTTDMGSGAGVYVMDRLTMGDQKLVRFLVELCRDNGVAVQKNVGGGTDASAIQRTGRGAVATTVGAPVRYMHSTVQLCHVADIDATIELLKLFMAHAHEIPVAGR
jgi:endoglucanase